jgi:hypothetical protein
MSIVSKDVIFHVKFDLEGAKKELDKQHKDTALPESQPQRGAPHKAEAKQKRGMNTAEQLISQKYFAEQFGKGNTPQAKKTLKKVSPGGYPRKARNITLEIKDILSRQQGPSMFGMEKDAVPKAIKFFSDLDKKLKSNILKRHLSRVSLKNALKASEEAKEGLTAESLIAKGFQYGKGLLGVGKAVAPAYMLYKLAQNSPMILAGYASAGLSGYGGDWLAYTASRLRGLVSDSILKVKSVTGKPMAFMGYDADMAHQGKKGYAANMGALGGENLGTIKYDIDQSQERLNNAMQRCNAMMVGQSYGNWYANTSFYKGVYDYSLKKCDEIASLWRKR